MNSNGQTDWDNSESEQPVCQISSGWNILEYVLFCLVLWWVSYWFLIILTRKSKEWCCRVLTTVHGLSITFLTVWDILINRNKLPFQNTSLTSDHKVLLCFMLSYFLFDFLWICIFGNEPGVIYIHHISSILIIMKIMAVDFGGMVVSYAAAGLEFTNPYLQLRWFLRAHGYNNTPLYIGVEIILFSTFFVIRVVGGTILFYKVEMYGETDLVMKLSFFSIYAVSLVLVAQICSYIKKKYVNQIRRPGSEPSLPHFLSNHASAVASSSSQNDANENLPDTEPVCNFIATNYASISESRGYPKETICETDSEKTLIKKEE